MDEQYFIFIDIMLMFSVSTRQCDGDEPTFFIHDIYLYLKCPSSFYSIYLFIFCKIFTLGHMCNSERPNLNHSFIHSLYLPPTGLAVSASEV